MATTFTELISSNLPILIDFYAEWCGPCKAMMPELDRFANDHSSAIKVVKINIDQYLQDALEFEVRGVPTLVLLKDGKELWRNSGTLNYAQMVDAINKYI
jgi:thioredoxin 1